MDVLNEKLISKLKNNVTRKLNNQDDIVDINNLYGVFIPNDDINKFIICKEENTAPNVLILSEFFTDEYIDYFEVRINKIVYPWREAGMHYFISFHELGFCLPLANLIGKHHKDGKVNRKDLAYLYCIINEYLKKNPEFVNELIENEKVR